MKGANPYLNFKGNTEEAFNYYRSVFGGEFPMLVRFRDFPDNGMQVPEADLDKIAHIALPLGGENMLMGTDAVGEYGESLTFGTNFYITVSPESANEADTIFDGLSSGGQVQMPLQRTEWAEKYGSCVDRFGVQWMVSYEGSVKFAESRR
jgi:PhnB protein